MSNKLDNALIVHGSYGSPSENWFPWLKGSLEELGVSVRIPQFPTPDGQSLESWRHTFDREVGDVGRGWAVVGHSLGVAFLLDVLERSDEPVECSLFASGFTELLGLEEYDSVNKTFVERTFDWSAIKERTGSSYLYHGSNDPYVPPALGEKLAQNIDGRFRLIPNGGHLNAAAGYESFEMLLDDMKLLISDT